MIVPLISGWAQGFRDRIDSVPFASEIPMLFTRPIARPFLQAALWGTALAMLGGVDIHSVPGASTHKLNAIPTVPPTGLASHALNGPTPKLLHGISPKVLQGAVAPVVSPANQSADERVYLREVRLRKLHMVRPDLVPYPIYFEIYC